MKTNLMGTATVPAFTVSCFPVNAEFSYHNRPFTTTNPTNRAALAFNVGCFSVNTEFPYESTCIVESFDDESLQSWLKTHAAIEKGVSSSEKKGFIYVFRIDGVDFTDITDCDLSKTAAYKIGQTVHPEQRKRQWQLQCPSQKHTWFTPVAVEHCHCVGEYCHYIREGITYLIVGTAGSCCHGGDLHTAAAQSLSRLRVCSQRDIPLVGHAGDRRACFYTGD
ncbi:hypothetical protein AAF712_014194 [Marasmius tenuissimus]|uniref:Bacteriophage T5 Orf172 DNA-binding domain-containing protein n=1 Tax=Marasmius tenuissimus TaxID=585030 RepID=A0ABR2ZCP8_9AGAR